MASLADIRFGVIDDARQRQRHRRRLVWAALLLMAVVALALALDQPPPDRPASTARAVWSVTPSSVLSREPYMGVACGIPNSTACDRMGLAVWLKRPALAVNAEIRGRQFSLSDRSLSTPIRNHRRKDFAGYLRGAGLSRTYHLPERWLGAQPPVHQLVRLRIDYGTGPVVETRLRVWLMAGWG
jgi:hypothetical protein